MMDEVRKRALGASEWLGARPWFGPLLALCALKAWMLFEARDRLTQEHWRVSGGAPELATQVGLALLLGVAALLPLLLGFRGRASTARKSGLIFCAASLAFFMPTVVSMNYGAILFQGRLGIAEVGSYLLNSIFFSPPYFAVHIAIVAAGWWLGARRGDDRWFFAAFASALFSMVVALLVREERFVSWKEIAFLGVLLVLGLAQVRWRWRLGPLDRAPFVFVMMLLGWVLFVEDRSAISLTFQCGFLLLGMGFAKCVVQERAPRGLLRMFLIYLYLLLINGGYKGADNMGNALEVSLLLGRYFAEDALIVWAIFTLTKRLGRLARISFFLIFAIYFAASYVDVNYQLESGRRLSGFMLEMGGGTGMAVKMVSGYLTPSFFAVFAVFVVGAGVLVFPPRQKKAFAPIHIGVCSALAFALLGGWFVKGDPFVASLARNLAAESNWARALRSPRVEHADLIAGFKALRAPLLMNEDHAPSSERARMNLVLVILESMPNRELSLFGADVETQPLMREYEDRMERYPNVFCSWPSSNHARTTIWSGLYPIRSYLSVERPRIARGSLTEILETAGYHNAFFYSSSRHYTRLNDYLGHRGLHRVEDLETLSAGLDPSRLVSWGVREDVTLEAMSAFLAEPERAEDPFAMIYVPACPHMPYDTVDERFNKFKEGWGQLDGNYTGAYRNQLLYMDWILHSLMKAVESNGLLENTVVLFVNDHGEQINAEEGGGLGHGWSCEPGVANIPLIAITPETRGGVNRSVGSQVDILPTILDYLDLPAPDDMPMQGVSLRNGAPASRRLYLGSYRDRALLENGVYYWFPHGKPDEARAYALRNEGAKTHFDEQPLAREKAEALLEDSEEFERLRESYIRHYESYEWKSR